MYFSVNELSIDDDILTYNERKETFINYHETIQYYLPQDLLYYEGEEYEHDALHMFGLHVS